MRRELQTIHEYEADEAVLDYGIDAKSYQLLLIKKAAGSRLQSITNSLHQSSIKSNPWARAKYLLAVPVAALSVAVLSTPQASALSKEISECKVSEFFANHQISEQKNTPKVEIRTVSGNAEIDKDVIFFVDGKRVSSIDDINPENIDHMEVLKDKDAMAKFGITEARGVILITTKSSGKTIHLKLDSVPSAKGQFQPSAKGEFKPSAEDEFHPAVIIVDPALPMVEDMPEYPGGMEAMMKFVAENLKYPQQMQKEKVEGGRFGDEYRRGQVAPSGPHRRGNPRGQIDAEMEAGQAGWQGGSRAVQPADHLQAELTQGVENKRMLKIERGLHFSPVFFVY